MNQTVGAILILTLCYLAFGAYGFGVFLQQPFIAGQVLTVQAALEPFAYLLSMVVGNVVIFRAVVSRPRFSGSILDENRLLAPAIALLLLVAFGAGLHTAGTLVEETFHSTSLSISHPDDFAYEVAFWVEEYLSHYLIAIPYVLLFFLLVRVELNREPSSLVRYEKLIVVGCGLLLGGCFAVGSFESAASDLLIVPLNLFLLAKFQRVRKHHGSPFWGCPLAAYWLIGTVLMTCLALAFRFTHGWFTQPTDLGFGVAGGVIQ